MFKVIRSNPAPKGLSTSKGYQSEDVVKELQKIFHNKCYLCESYRIEAPEVEHFIPRSVDPKKENDWNNLFYSCRRCNSIKTSRSNSIMDCTKIDPSNEIIIEVPTRNSRPIIVEPVNENESRLFIHNTIDLLKKCYNEDNSAYRGITKSELRRKINEHLGLYFEHIKILKNYQLSDHDKKGPLERLKLMVQPTYPYHAIWRGMVIDDSDLMEEYGSYLGLIDEEHAKSA